MVFVIAIAEPYLTQVALVAEAVFDVRGRVRWIIRVVRPIPEIPTCKNQVWLLCINERIKATSESSMNVASHYDLHCMLLVEYNLWPQSRFSAQALS
jgi:hypothetical protein